MGPAVEGSELRILRGLKDKAEGVVRKFLRHVSFLRTCNHDGNTKRDNGRVAFVIFERNLNGDDDDDDDDDDDGDDDNDDDDESNKKQ